MTNKQTLNLTSKRGSGTSRETSLLNPSLITRPRWARTPGCSGSELDFIENPYPDLSAYQSGMPEAPPECATKRRSDLLLHMPCHLSKIQGLRWQGGSLERGCLAHREIVGDSWPDSWQKIYIFCKGASPFSSIPSMSA